MNKFGILALASTLLMGASGSSVAAVPWYAGVAGGVSSLRPDTENSVWTADSEASLGGGVFVGYDFSRRISLELGYNLLGNATLRNDTGTTDIGYTAFSAGGLMYLLGDASDIADRNGFAGFIRLGVNLMDNSATIRLDREDNVALLAGVGVEWPLSNKLSLRGELTTFDGDAQAARASVVYRPRSGSQRGRTPVAQTPQTPRVAQAPQVAQAPSAPAAPTVQQQPATPAPQPVPKVNPAPSLEVQPSTSIAQAGNCVAPVANEPADASGCAVFSGTLRGVEFQSGTAQLTPASAQLLDRLAGNLQRYPNISIEIQAHTESFGSESRAKEIARQRTLSVARHLAGRGIPVSRLRARAFGHSIPVADDNSPAGRRQNNRIVLRVL